MTPLNLKQAETIVAGAIARASELALKPLAIAIVDPGGHIISVQRQDGAAFLRPQIAIAKAAGALALGMSSRAIGAMATERPAFLASISALAPAGVAQAAGGVIITDAQGDVIGAAGASGDTSDYDEDCVLAGIAAAGLRGRP